MVRIRVSNRVRIRARVTIRICKVGITCHCVCNMAVHIGPAFMLW